MRRTFIVGGNPVSCEYKQRYYTNGISAALADFFLTEELKVILKNSFDSLFLQERYSSEELLRGALFKYALTESTKINSKLSEVISGQLAALAACYDFIWENYKELRQEIALTESSSGYPDALESLNDYIIYLKEVKDNVRAKIMEGVYNNCERKYLELTKNTPTPKGFKLPSQ